MERAAQVLAKLGREETDKLPRYQSPRSGRVFARMTSDDNSESWGDDSPPVDLRLNRGLAHFKASRDIMSMYLFLDLQSHKFGEEAVEVAGCTLRLIPKLHALAEQYFVTLDPSDPTYPVRKKGFEALPGSFMIMVSAAFLTLGDSGNYSEGARARLLGYLEQTLPSIYRIEPVASQAEIVARLRELEASPNLTFATDRLRSLREKLQAK
jgi:hypothetical protein